MKLTYTEDIFLLDKLFQLKSEEAESRELTQSTRRNLKDKVLVVFGGGYGIGGEIVKLAQACGTKVKSFSRSETGTDISKIEGISKALQNTEKEFGKIDFVINTAGILEKTPLRLMSEESIMRQISVNYTGAAFVAKESFPYLQKTGGALLLFASSSYTRGRSMYSLYSSSKAAIVNLTQALSEEWEEVRINCINPERTRTPMRTKNFGVEPEDSLLDPQTVAAVSLNTLFADFSGRVVDVKRKEKNIS